MNDCYLKLYLNPNDYCGSFNGTPVKLPKNTRNAEVFLKFSNFKEKMSVKIVEKWVKLLRISNEKFLMILPTVDSAHLPPVFNLKVFVK